MDFDIQSRNFLISDEEVIKKRYQLFRNYIRCQTRGAKKLLKENIDFKEANTKYHLSTYYIIVNVEV